jgi:hypothetical protein
MLYVTYYAIAIYEYCSRHIRSNYYEVMEVGWKSWFQVNQTTDCL